MPEALKGTRSPSPDDGSQPTVDGFDNWYDWCVANWGTKWDINDDGLVFEDTEDGYATISGWFESAWAPPIEAYNTYMENNEEIQILATYEEGGMDFAGIYDNGDGDGDGDGDGNGGGGGDDDDDADVLITMMMMVMVMKIDHTNAVDDDDADDDRY